MLVVGFDPSEIIAHCCQTLPYNRQMDVMRIIKLSIENLKEDGLSIVVNGITLIL